MKVSEVPGGKDNDNHNDKFPVLLAQRKLQLVVLGPECGTSRERTTVRRARSTTPIRGKEDLSARVTDMFPRLFRRAIKPSSSTVV